MKRIALFATTVLLTATSFAQTYNLTVTKDNGQTITIPTDEIVKMEFVAGDDDPSTVKKPKADLLDIIFKDDGTAEDISPMRNPVITCPGPTLMTYYSNVHQRNVANFRNPIGDGVTSGYYRVNYAKDGEFIRRIADGCTLETTVMLGDTDPANKEVKWFSSMQGGGIGFILPVHNASNKGTECLTFLPNTSTTGASTWRWTYSNVKPEVGTYYHVVGVWNKEEGKSYIYVNGELCGEASAPGSYVPVASGAESFVIGGDPANNQTDCHSSWNGDIVTARIYSDPMTAEQVAALWEAAKFDESAQTIKVNNLRYIQECEVSAGYRYTFYADGLESGDTVELQDSSKGTKISATSTCDGKKMTITVPAGLTSGSYRVSLRRGDATAPLFVVKFNVSDNAVEPVVPKVIAHRGAHTDGASENSIAALKKAMDANYYGIELDVWITTDNQLIVHHDGEANGLVFYQNTYDNIKHVKLSNGEYLPTFDSFIETFKSKMDSSDSKLIIEFKTHLSAERNNTAIDKAMKMVEEAGLKDRVEYIAFSFDNCKRIIANQPDAMVGYLMGDKDPATVLAAGIRSVDYSYAAYNNNPNWIKTARELGMTVNVWTINNELEMLKYIGLGANYITTDAPAVLTELCKMTFLEK